MNTKKEASNELASFCKDSEDILTAHNGSGNDPPPVSLGGRCPFFLLETPVSCQCLDLTPSGFPKWKEEPPRRINVAPEMMPAFIAALDNIKEDSGSELYKLLLFTGLRKSGVMD